MEGKNVIIKYNNLGYFENGELREIWEILNEGLDNLRARKASGFWAIIEGAPKEDGLPKILEELNKRERGTVSITFNGYSPEELAKELGALEPYGVEIGVSKYLG